ncbi:hypothetical protein [uncultured Phascolarctobacterium sp.]|jgi:hypothetical protein|uniref:hypothetical protein n=1 Tax=uncultured Phascolarctobacterium sp. TaxID=512296 RepID=UPI002600F74F|nr:hypothetical protein [uncultured Phascolarctobacterium sp.]
MYYFTKDWKLYILYYVVLFVLIEVPKKYVPEMELWKVYFPLKSMVLGVAIILANVHDEIRRCRNDKTAIFHFGRSYVVFSISFFINVVVIVLIVWLIKFYTGYDLSFIIV